MYRYKLLLKNFFGWFIQEHNRMQAYQVEAKDFKYTDEK